MERRSLRFANLRLAARAAIRFSAARLSAVRGSIVGGAIMGGALFVLAPTASLHAQALSPKRTITIGPAPGCGTAFGAPAAVARRDNVEARRLAAVGQEAALVGDQTAARNAYARAALLNPGDERVAYELGRSHEELADTTDAIGEFCRYLTLSPTGREATDVRDRLLRLVPRAEIQRADEVQVAFRLGLALLDDGSYDASARAFDDVVKNAPTAGEGIFNRGLARAAAGRRAAAMRDLEEFRASAPSADDRVAVGRAIEILRRPVYRRSATFAVGVLPGFGQFYTGRPVLGALVLAVVGSAVGAAFVERTTVEQIDDVGPNGVPAPYTVTRGERPYREAGLATAAGVSLIALIEAVSYAQRSQRGGSILARRGAPGTVSTSSGALSVAPTVDRFGRAGMHLRIGF